MKKSWLLVSLLVLYCVLLVKIIVLKDIPTIRIGSLMLNFGGTQGGSPNFTPFRTILPYLMGRGGWIIAGINIVGNIVLLVPLGFLLPFIFKQLNWKSSLIVAILSALFIELLQSMLHIGIFDIDDVILNALGCMMGYWKFLFLPIFLKWMKKSKIALAAFITLIGFIVYIFVSFYQHSSAFKGPDPHMRNVLLQSAADSDQNDLCGGTGGTGQIVAITSTSITIQRKDGVEENIHIIKQTVIKSSRGESTLVDLKIGNRVTVVVGLIETDPKAASMILVCKEKN